MTTTRALVLLIVLAGVLFAISLALGNRNSGLSVDPARSWFTKLAPSQTLDFAEVSTASGWQNAHWTIPPGVREATLQIKPSARGQTIRRVKIGLQATSKFKLEFAPTRDKDHPDTFADAEATELTIDEFRPGQSPLELTVLKHGGELKVTRRDNAASGAVFTFDSTR